MITWHARVYNLRKYRPTTANYIKLGKSGTRRSPDKLYERLGPEVMRQWRLRNGEPANFQGDERDLIIISTVVAVNPTIPASRVSAMTGNAAMRRTF